MPLHECFHVPVTSCQRAEVKRVLHCDATTRADMNVFSSDTFYCRDIFTPTTTNLQYTDKSSKCLKSFRCAFVYACIFQYLAEDFSYFLLKNFFYIAFIDIRVGWKKFVNPVSMLCNLLIAADIFLFTRIYSSSNLHFAFQTVPEELQVPLLRSGRYFPF